MYKRAVKYVNSIRFKPPSCSACKLVSALRWNIWSSLFVCGHVCYIYLKTCSTVFIFDIFILNLNTK